eukprot:802448-Amorphochlora_amoeboformis.AAC.1
MKPKKKTALSFATPSFPNSAPTSTPSSGKKENSPNHQFPLNPYHSRRISVITYSSLLNHHPNPLRLTQAYDPILSLLQTQTLKAEVSRGYPRDSPDLLGISGGSPKRYHGVRSRSSGGKSAGS